jgi:hypothetical protein
MVPVSKRTPTAQIIHFRLFMADLTSCFAIRATIDHNRPLDLGRSRPVLDSIMDGHHSRKQNHFAVPKAAKAEQAAKPAHSAQVMSRFKSRY